MLIEVGDGFAYMGKQVKLSVGDEDIYLDLLFYNTKIHAYVVVELKTGAFESAFIGQLGLYISAVNHFMKSENDNPTIGLLICKERNNIKAQWTLESTSYPIGISNYQLSNEIQENITRNLPSIESLEAEYKRLEHNTAFH